MSIRNERDCRIAVVTPIFKHSRLAADAISAVLAQPDTPAIRIVLVNDGCPFPESHELCRSFATAYPDRIDYIHRPNGGLSAARNTGINHILRTLPRVEAVYFLDADNQLEVGSLNRAWRHLQEHPSAGWVYPDIDMFGIEQSYSCDGAYSLLLHAHENICEAGSLVRTELLRGGLRFDESMRLGFEDWDFWLSAARLGHRGVHLPSFGFRYRKRAESMLTNSARDQTEIRAYLRRKHAWLYNPRTLAQLEHAEAPRFAFYDVDNGTVLLGTDLNSPSARLSMAEFSKRYWQWVARPHADHFPPFVVSGGEALLREYASARILHAIVWHLEESLRFAPVSMLVEERVQGDRAHVMSIIPGRSSTTEDHLKSPLLMMRTTTLLGAVDDADPTWMSSLGAAQPHFQIWPVTVSRGEGATLRRPAAAGLLALYAGLRFSAFAAGTRSTAWRWKAASLPSRSRLSDLNREVLHGDQTVPAANFVASQDTRHIGFVLPFAGFGGVDKVTYATAAALRIRGWTPHLIITHADRAELPPEHAETFATIDFAADPNVGQWTQAGSYYGTPLGMAHRSEQLARMVSRLCWMDAVAVCQSNASYGLLGELRRKGVVTAVHLHVRDETPGGRPVGHPYLALAHEHAVDLFATCSEQLRNWLEGFGVPHAKTVVVPNAPGFDIDDQAAQRAIVARSERTKDVPLRVLFLGRLDRQKGLDRLRSVIGRTRASGVPFEWRLVGKAVVEDASDELVSIRDLLRPPVYTPEGLIAHYEWADVSVLLSRWEGVPLTLLEAMRMGCVPLATDVGAVSEVVSDGRNGLLVPSADPGAVNRASELLLRLATDRGQLRALSLEASAYQSSWPASTAAFAKRLEELVRIRRTHSHRFHEPDAMHEARALRAP